MVSFLDFWQKKKTLIFHDSIPNPIKKGEILLRNSLLMAKTISTPTNASAAKTELMLKPPLLIPYRANIIAVRVAPTRLHVER